LAISTPFTSKVHLGRNPCPIIKLKKKRKKKQRRHLKNVGVNEEDERIEKKADLLVSNFVRK
jgi:hypothetical protein